MLYLLIIFLGAFLLFQVQPLIAKQILPLFGGGAAIWTACILFFQAFLLFGYLYAHCLTKLNSIRKQAGIHAVILLASLYFLPITVAELRIDIGENSPTIKILHLLTISVGLPYFMLATTGPLVQRWLSYTDCNNLPYRLYSLSNLGSLIALVSYPFIIEPWLTNEQQSTFWSSAYFSFALAFVILSYSMINRNNLLQAPTIKLQKTKGRTKTAQALWLFLSAVGVLLLVSTTNAMTQNIPPVPFLWILPLCIYLVTFIISFYSPQWYVRWYWFVVFSIAAFVAILLFFIGSQFDIITQVVLYSVILLSGCMICHGELALLKPDVERLTLYYLLISIGGFAGSVFVSFVAQNMFNQFFEFPLAIFLIFASLAASITWQNRTLAKVDKPLNTKNVDNIAVENFSSGQLLIAANIIALLLLLPMFFYLKMLFSTSDVISTRNFYGILSVKDVEQKNGEKERRLIDGTTSHGTQSLDPKKEHIARSYYRANTGVAFALEYLGRNGQIEAGFVGLGAGTLAAYGRAGDNFTFYELNPNVVRIANSHFTYLKQTNANIELVLGDGRVSLTDELSEKGSRQYQLLVIDAFSGGSIPIHLLTEEAFNIYWQHIARNGILAVHVSNSHLDLSPVVRGLAKRLNKNSYYVKTLAEHPSEHDVEWILLTDSETNLNRAIRFISDEWPNSANERIVWTDNSSNLLSVLR